MTSHCGSTRPIIGFAPVSGIGNAECKPTIKSIVTSIGWRISCIDIGSAIVVELELATISDNQSQVIGSSNSSSRIHSKARGPTSIKSGLSIFYCHTCSWDSSTSVRITPGIWIGREPRGIKYAISRMERGNIYHNSI